MIPIKFIVLAVIGIIISVGGGVLYAVFPNIISDKIKENFKIVKGSEAYDTWKELPIPIQMKFHFFNVTNSEEVVQLGAIPILKEIGPYTYLETRMKENITWNDDDHTVTYRQRKIYTFSRELSVGSEDDLMIVPNIPLIAAFRISENLHLPLNMVKKNIRDEKLYVTQSVSELLFAGYYVSLFDKLGSVLSQIPPDKLLPNNTFGLFYGQNNTDDGEYVVYTGEDDVSKFGQIVSWNGQPQVSVWKNGSYCNQINGTDGAQFPPFVDKSDRLYIFISDVRRSLYLIYDREVENKDIKNYRYILPGHVFADPLLNPDNDCFCMDKECPFAGLIGVSTWKQDAPVYISSAHFAIADPTLLQGIEGLNPDLEKHSIFLDIEPTTGIVMGAARRIQINVAIKSAKDWLLSGLFPWPTLIHPVLWQEEGAFIDDANADKFKSMVQTPIKIGVGVAYTLIVLGIVMVLIAILFIWRHKNSDPKSYTLK